MQRFDALKTLSAEDFALALVFDKNGEQRSVCSMCQRFEEDNCDDHCLRGVTEYLEREV